jgi:hypothetical protein
MTDDGRNDGLNGHRKPGKRVPVSTRCDEDIWAEARATTRGMMAIDPSYSLADLVEQAIAREVRRLQEEYNHGKAWPSATKPLRRGRRVSD